MKFTTHIRCETESLEDIYSQLEGRVFHVTKLANLKAIQKDKEIKPNGDGQLVSPFGNIDNSFFRRRNCICLFDYRPEPTNQIMGFRERCNPFKPARLDSDGVAILLLKPDIYASIIPWTRWKEEGESTEKVVNYVEAGYKGSISIDLIDEVICLILKEDPKSQLALIRKAEMKHDHGV